MLTSATLRGDIDIKNCSMNRSSRAHLVDHCIIFTRNQGIAITVLSKSVNVRANSVCRANNVKGTSPPSWNNKTIRKTTTHLEHHQKNYIYQSINNNNSNKNIARIEFDHSCQEVQTQFPPPGSPGESPSRTHEPPSTQNGFESKKGPQNDPPLIHFVVTLHLVLASQIQPMQLSLKPFGVGSHWYSWASRGVITVTSWKRRKTPLLSSILWLALGVLLCRL